MTKARKVAPPAASAMASRFAGADLLDAYAIALPEGASDDVEVLARTVFAHGPRWVTPLMAVRDGVVGRLGIKTATAIQREGSARAAGTVGFFPVQERHAREIVLGEDDRHLDFRLSALVRDVGDGERELVVTTVVHCRNGLGRAYLTVIAPFHRAIVPAYLNGAERRGWACATVAGEDYH